MIPPKLTVALQRVNQYLSNNLKTATQMSDAILPSLQRLAGSRNCSKSQNQWIRLHIQTLQNNPLKFYVQGLNKKPRTCRPSFRKIAR